MDITTELEAARDKHYGTSRALSQIAADRVRDGIMVQIYKLRMMMRKWNKNAFTTTIVREGKIRVTANDDDTLQMGPCDGLPALLIEMNAVAEKLLREYVPHPLQIVIERDQYDLLRVVIKDR